MVDGGGGGGGGVKWDEGQPGQLYSQPGALLPLQMQT